MARANDGIRIPVPVVAQEDSRLLEFSFKYLDVTNQKFSLERCSPEFLKALLESIQVHSNAPVSTFVEQNNKENRHMNDWPLTTEPDGFSTLDPDQLAYNDVWQFAPIPKQRWRVHGLLIENVFYVVWLDPDHLLCP